MKIFLPGDFLATEEEFSTGENTFEENGSILADSQGTLLEDKSMKTVSIAKTKKITPLKIGSIIIGIVSFVKTNSVSIEISPMKKGAERQMVGGSYAMLPVRNVAEGYVKDLHAEFKIGDIIKAKISELKPWGTDLRTNDRNLGVIKAFCGHCRHPLMLFGNSLKCTECGSTETRKLSDDYGKAEGFE
ncbi:MAG TPA: exosome complex RNA-binding protein Csl4 [archaeon]|nr:exosome complex RNA-binding protein Csl4 [archaeon]